MWPRRVDAWFANDALLLLTLGAAGSRAVVGGSAGPMRAAAQRRLSRGGKADSEHLTGSLDRSKIRAICRWADVVLAPADLESFGIAALEAHCAGLPVVAKRAGGIGEFVADGRNGLLGDTDADLVDALVALCADSRLRAGLTDRDVAKHVDWPQVLASTELL